MTATDLRALRKKLGLTQAQLAHKLGVPFRTYQNWEYGGTKRKKRSEHGRRMSAVAQALVHVVFPEETKAM